MPVQQLMSAEEERTFEIPVQEEQPRNSDSSASEEMNLGWKERTLEAEETVARLEATVKQVSDTAADLRKVFDCRSD